LDILTKFLTNDGPKAKEGMASRVVAKSQKAESFLATAEVGLAVRLRGVVAEIELQHAVRNNSGDVPVEARYELALGAGAAVHALEAELADGKRVVAQLAREDAAQAQYDDAIAAGASAALLETEPTASESVSLSLGSIPPQGGVHCVVRYTLVAAIGQGVLAIKFPCVASKEGRVPVLQLRVAADDLPGTAAAVVLDSTAIPRAALEGLVLGSSGFTGRLQLADADLTKQLVLRVELNAMQQCGAFVEGDAMVAWCPAVTASTAAATTSQSASRRSPIDATFIIDRSGSMRGEKIVCAQEALLLMVSSLPVGSCFNVIGFGTTVDLLFAQGSESVTDETLALARRWIVDIEPNLGGTDLLSPLAIAVTQRRSAASAAKSLPHIVIVMTDGHVENNAQVLAFVRDNAGALSSTRIFALGIGENVDSTLVEGIARAGAGGVAFVQHAAEIRPAVMGFMQRSTLGLLPYPTFGITVDASDCPIDVHPRTGSLFADETAVLFGFVGQKVQTTAKTTVRFSGGQEVQAKVLLQQADECRGAFGRVAALVAITDLLQNASANANDEAARLSLEYGVLCRLTAFVSVLQCKGEATRASMASVAFPSGADAAAIAKKASQASQKHKHDTKNRAKVASPTKIGSAKVASTVMIGGVPCTVAHMTTSKTGKHGSAKAHVVAVDQFTGKKIETVVPLSRNVGDDAGSGAEPAPTIERRRYTLLVIDDDMEHCEVLDEACEQKKLKVSLRLRESERFRACTQSGNFDDITVVSLVVGEREEAVEIIETMPSQQSPSTAAATTTRGSSSLAIPSGWSTMGPAARLAFLQSANGSWSHSRLLDETLGIAVGRLLAETPVNVAQQPELWVTSVVLAFLEARQQGTKTEWQLMVEKGADWIAAQQPHHSAQDLAAVNAATLAFVARL